MFDRKKRLCQGAIGEIIFKLANGLVTCFLYMVKFLPWCVWRIRMWSWNVFLGAEETSEINQSFATYSTKSWHHKLLTNPRILPYFPPVSYPFSKGISWPSVQGPFLLGHQGSRCHSCEWLGTGDLGGRPQMSSQKKLGKRWMVCEWSCSQTFCWKWPRFSNFRQDFSPGCAEVKSGLVYNHCYRSLHATSPSGGLPGCCILSIWPKFLKPSYDPKQRKHTDKWW